jgi:hypothetical protein
LLCGCFVSSIFPHDIYAEYPFVTQWRHHGRRQRPLST